VTAAAWLQAHATGARQLLDLSIAGLVGLHVPSPWARYRRAAAAAFCFLKGARMSTQTTTTIALAVLKASIASFKLEEAVRTAPDAASRRAALIAGVPEVVSDLAAGFGLPAEAIAAYATPQLVGDLFDLEEMARTAIESRVPHAAALAALHAPDESPSAEHVEGANDGLGGAGG
jgi:hypothetical protein